MKYIIDSKESINDTLAKCKPGDSIYLKNGIYNEKVEVRIDNLTIIGESQNNTIIANMDYYHKIMPDHNECNTFRTYTVYVGSNNVNICNLTIKNKSTPSSIYGQAVALHVQGDNFKCENASIVSAQDTLFTGPLPDDLCLRHQGFLPNDFITGLPSRQKYINCNISGDVDFIFGGATALFEKCKITALRNENISSNKTFGYIAAPSHSKDTPYGYLFYNCDITSENENNRIFYARPWRDYGCAAFIECNVTNDINPSGFNKWNNTTRDKTARFFEYTENTDLSKREPWVHLLSKDEANQYVNDFKKYLENK
ncbi:MAG: pectin esterase [Erysipelotrichaceae bacterium]|nr:pectin esterase [Erysipelotrichaceae bacterium]